MLIILSFGCFILVKRYYINKYLDTILENNHCIENCFLNINKDIKNSQKMDSGTVPGDMKIADLKDKMM